MAELLLELLSEEIPARMQLRAADDLKRLVTEKLVAQELDHDEARAFVTPRRLALVIEGLGERQPDRIEERRGPRVGAPDNAIEGFLRAAGIDSLDQCEQREVGKATFWFATRRVEGRPTAEVLPGILAEAIREIPWPKSMRWGDTEHRYVRPLHGVLAVLDGVPVPGAVDFGGTAGHLAFGSTTLGHRFMAGAEIEVSDFASYRAALEGAFVLLDSGERREVIRGGLAERAREEGLSVRHDPGLLDEVAGLVEWPVPMVGAIDEAYMTLPQEVLTTSMRNHQKVFALERPDGALAPRFGFVANIAPRDGGASVRAGNERVLRARLADAGFFWDTDRARPLAERLPELEEVVFHARLGNLAERAARLEVLAEALAPRIAGADVAEARLAAGIAKADLTTGMVGEFPELQGVMGRYYALEEGLPAVVADAIAEHYSPQGPNDACPRAPVSVAVALADKIDLLAGFFAIDEKPTGSRDPYALRRAALGIIRLVLENELRLPLLPTFTRAVRLYTARLMDDLPPAGEVAGELLDFLADRIEVHLRGEGVPHDHVRAVFALGGEDDLVRLIARVEALRAFLESDDGANLLMAYRRARNIVQIEEKRDGRSHAGEPDAALFVEPEEHALADALATATGAADEAVEREDFSAAMATLAGLRSPVDEFFDRVTVNVDDAPVRANRLALLARIGATMERLADFSRIEG